MTTLENAIITLKCYGVSPHKVIHKIDPTKLDLVDATLDKYWICLDCHKRHEEYPYNEGEIIDGRQIECGWVECLRCGGDNVE